MKTEFKLKLLTVCLSAAVLSSCGGDDDDNNSASNSAPSHSGNLEINLLESDNEFIIDLLDGVVDTDVGDVIRITDLTTEETDLSGIENRLIEIVVTPSSYASGIDTGMTKTIVYNYSLSDGKASVPRTLTINIEGADVAPEFDDLNVSISEDATDFSVDLMQGIVDGDGETVLLSNITPDAGNTAGAATVDGNTVTIDPSSFADNIKGGDIVPFVFTYTVSDHNHDLPRTATINITGISTEPEPPSIIAPFIATVTTDDAIQYADLADSQYAIDWNGDDISIDFGSIKPTNGGPELVFNKSNDTTLAVDPVDFAPYLDVIGAQDSFTYSYVMRDNGGLEETASFTVDVTKAAPTNKIANGSFESGDLTDWLVTNEVDGATTTVASSGDAWDGGFHIVSTGETDLSANLEVEANAGYYVRAVDNLSGSYGAYFLDISHDLEDGTTVTDNFARFVEQPIGDNPYPLNAFHVATFKTDSLDARRRVTFTTEDMVLDDVFASKYSTDPANNLVYQVGANNVGFESGSMENWEILGAGTAEITTDAARVISGNASLYVTDYTTLRLKLPVGAIQDGKKYLLKFDVRVLTHATSNDDGGFSPMSISLAHADNYEDFIAFNPVTVLGSDWTAEGKTRSVNFLREAELPDSGVYRFEQYYEIGAFDTAGDWSTREMQIQVSLNHWTRSGEFVMDNIELIELP